MLDWLAVNHHRHKVEMRMAVLKLHLSDEKLLALSDMFHHVPVPHSFSMMGLDDTLDAYVQPDLVMVVRHAAFPFNVNNGNSVCKHKIYP